MIEYLLKACEVAERGAAVAHLRQIGFRDGRLHAFNGMYQYQAPSSLPPDEEFAVSEERLASALRSCGETVQVAATAESLRLKNGPFTVRVRKLKTPIDYERIALPKSASKQKADFGLLDALKVVHPFMSSDASRPWSVAVLLKDGYAWATNNLALVRSPITLPSLLEGVKIPAPAVTFLCSLPKLDYFHIDDQKRMIVVCDKALIRFPQSQANWPDMSKFFAKMPKKLPEVPKEFASAALQIERLSDRFMSLTSLKVEAKTESLESEYEVEFAKGKGTYSSKLLSLILSFATHADFSFFPEPVFFKGIGIEGTAVGIKEGASI